MRYSSFAILALFCVVQVYGWIGVYQFDPTGNHTSYCYGPDLDVGNMEKNEVKRVKDECALAECRDDRSVKVTGCAPVNITPPCYLGKGDLAKPFPDCCFEIICPDKSET